MALGRYCQLCGEAKKTSEILAEAHGVVVNVDCLITRVYGDPPAPPEQVQALVRFCGQCGADLPEPRPDACPRCAATTSAAAAEKNLAARGPVPPLETRAVAFLIDTAIVAVLAWLGVIALARVDQAFFGPPAEPAAAWELGLISGIAVFMLYHTLFTALIGATPGKLSFGLRVVLKDGSSSLGLFRSLLRSGLYFLTLYVFPLGLVLMVLYEPRQNWRRIIEDDALFHNPLTDTAVINPR